MITVYVKHYLNEVGATYFDQTWFPYVEERIAKQDGFLLVETSRDLFDPGCRNITVKFVSRETLDLWIAHADHQSVLGDLDPFRIKPWHYSVVEGEQPSAPADIQEWSSVS